MNRNAVEPIKPSMVQELEVAKTRGINTYRKLARLDLLIRKGVSRLNPGEGNSNPVQYSCLKNSMNRGTC